MKLILSLFFIFFLISCGLSEHTRFAESGSKLQEEKAHVLVAIGNDFMVNGRLIKATEQFMSAIKVRPDHAEAHYHLGLVLLRRNFLSRGLSSVQKAISLKPNFTQAHNFLARFYLEKKKLRKALQHSVAASRDLIYQNQEESWTLLSIIYSKLKQNGRALVSVRRAKASKPKDCFYRYNISRILLENKKTDLALEAARQADPLCPGKKEKEHLLYLKAVAYFNSSKYIASKSLLDSFQPLSPKIRKSRSELLSKIESLIVSY